jgi:hypothetical protein
LVNFSFPLALKYLTDKFVFSKQFSVKKNIEEVIRLRDFRNDIECKVRDTPFNVLNHLLSLSSFFSPFFSSFCRNFCAVRPSDGGSIHHAVELNGKDGGGEGFADLCQGQNDASENLDRKFENITLDDEILRYSRTENAKKTKTSYFSSSSILLNNLISLFFDDSQTYLLFFNQNKFSFVVVKTSHHKTKHLHVKKNMLFLFLVAQIKYERKAFLE